MVSERKKILVISYSQLSRDPRVIRQVTALKDEYFVTTMGFDEAGMEHSHITLVRNQKTKFGIIKKGTLLALKLFNKLDSMECKMYAYDSNLIDDYDLIICNDSNCLPLGFDISKGKIPVWGDLHEYAPRQLEHLSWWRILFQPYIIWQTKKYLPQCDILSTVGLGLQEKYKSEFNIHVNYVIYNAPKYEPLEPQSVGNEVKLVHHGGASKHRHLENLILMLEQLGEGYTLDFYLVAINEKMKKYLSELKDLAQRKDLPVYFNEPVPTNKIAEVLNKYDVGVYILKPINFNHKYAMPNKIFEFIQARLCIAVSPNPDMKALVEEYDLGIVSKNYTHEELAKRILGLSRRKIEEYKVNCHGHSRQLSSEKSIVIIKEIADKIIN